MVGRKLANLGDEIDALYQEQFEDIIELYDDPQEAFRSFSQVLENVFNWEDGELRKCIHVWISSTLTAVLTLYGMGMGLYSMEIRIYGMGMGFCSMGMEIY